MSVVSRLSGSPDSRETVVGGGVHSQRRNGQTTSHLVDTPQGKD